MKNVSYVPHLIYGWTRLFANLQVNVHQIVPPALTSAMFLFLMREALEEKARQTFVLLSATPCLCIPT